MVILNQVNLVLFSGILLPSNQLLIITGVKFTSYDWAKPEITLPEIFNSFKIGQTIAIYSKYNKSFIRINGDNGESRFTPTKFRRKINYPKEWEWERFKIIDAGNDEIALYNVNLKRFILMNQNNEMKAKVNQQMKIRN